MTAVLASKASMSRNCSVAVPGGPTFCQVAPAFVVRRTVPRLPLAQTTSSLTAARPIRSARRFAIGAEPNTWLADAWRNATHRAVEPRPRRVDALRASGREPRDQEVPPEHGHADPAARPVGNPVDASAVRRHAVREDAPHPLDLLRVEHEELERPEPGRAVRLRS